MDKALQTMIDNLEKNTGKKLGEWIGIVKKENFEKHGQAVKFLKEVHGITHGYANMIVQMARDDNSLTTDAEDLVSNQYKGKEHFSPLYQKLLEFCRQLGSDVEVSPKKAYVSLRRKKQFATLKPATKTRFEIGINLKGHPSEGKLLEIKLANAMCSHKIDLTNTDDVTQEVLAWLKSAYENAG